MQCSYYNFEVNAWEPVIEPTFRTENKYRPWEISIKVSRSKIKIIYVRKCIRNYLVEVIFVKPGFWLFF